MRNFFLTVWELSPCSSVNVVWEGLIWVADFLLCSQMMKGTARNWQGLYYKGTNLILHEGSTFLI